MGNRNLVKHHGKLGAYASGGGVLYASVPVELARDGKLSAYAKAVALYVWSHDEKFQQSAAAVAEAIGMDRGTVGKALAELQERGWLVREIKQTVGKSGKPRTLWERWHLQMTNKPFTAEEIEELSVPKDVRVTPAPSDGTCGSQQHVRAGATSTLRAGQTSTIEVQEELHLEVQFISSAEESQVDDGFEGPSSSTVEVEEEEQESASGAASEPVTVEPEGFRPSGLNNLIPSIATGSSSDDPFASEPGEWLAKHRELEAKRDASSRTSAAAAAWSAWDN